MKAELNKLFLEIKDSLKLMKIIDSSIKAHVEANKNHIKELRALLNNQIVDSGLQINRYSLLLCKNKKKTNKELKVFIDTLDPKLQQFNSFYHKLKSILDQPINENRMSIAILKLIMESFNPNDDLGIDSELMLTQNVSSFVFAALERIQKKIAEEVNLVDKTLCECLLSSSGLLKSKFYKDESISKFSSLTKTRNNDTSLLNLASLNDTEIEIRNSESANQLNLQKENQFWVDREVNKRAEPGKLIHTPAKKQTVLNDSFAKLPGLLSNNNVNSSNHDKKKLDLPLYIKERGRQVGRNRTVHRSKTPSFALGKSRKSNNFVQPVYKRFNDSFYQIRKELTTNDRKGYKEQREVNLDRRNEFPYTYTRN